MSRIRALLALPLLLCAGVSHPVWSQTTLLDVVQTLASPTVAVPKEDTFTISNPGDYNLTLTDLGAVYGAPLASVELAVTANDVVVGTPLTAAGTLLLKGLQPGTYQFHVTGKSGTGAGSGPFGVGVVSTAGGTPVVNYSDTLALPLTTTPNNEATLDETFTVSSAGTYQVSLTDLKLPASLSTLSLAIVEASATSPIVILPDSTGAYTATVQLTTGVSYRLFAVGVPGSTTTAGLFSATVAPSGGGTAVYQATEPVGTFTSLGNTPTLSSGPYTITLADLATPAALTQVAGVLIQNGSVVTSLSAAGSQNFTSSGGVYQLFGFAAPASTPGVGSYTLTLQPSGGSPVMSLAEAVAASGSTSSAYSYNTTVTAAGSYALNLADFTFPRQFTSLSAIAVQNGTLLGTPLKAAGTTTVTTAAGRVSLLVFAQAASSGSLFGLDLTPSAGGTSLFATTQGVGQLFSSQVLNVPSSGTYTVAVSDLGFPAPFASLAAIVTQGSQQFGQIYTSGTFQLTAAGAGDYLVTFVAQPNTTSAAGTFALNVSLQPTLTFTSSATSVTAGGTVTLNWSSQSATACVASNGWSGSEPLSGPATSPAINTTTTFTLTCTGPGGSVAKSVTVTTTAAQKSGGGGGAVDIDAVLLLVGVLLLRLNGKRAVP